MTLETPEQARCGRHPDAPAETLCARCGDLVCPECMGGSAESCAACRARLGLDRIAWERPVGGGVERWWRTTTDVLFRSSATFAGAAPGRWSAALVYLVTLLVPLAAVSSAATVPALLSWKAAVPLAVLHFVGLMIFHGTLFLGRAVAFHAAVRLAGGRGIAASVWGCAYAHAPLVFYPFVFAFTRVSANPVVATVLVLATELWLIGELAMVAKHSHGLSDGRAAFAALAPALLLVTLFGACCLFGAYPLL